MKVTTKIYPLTLLAALVILASCGSQNDLATNYYADGIYFDPEYGNLLAENETTEEQPTTPDRFDYYEPGTYTSPYEQPLNNGWGSSGWNSGLGMNSPWGWNSGINLCFGTAWGMPGWGNPYDYYSPYYNPYWNGYSPYWGYPGWNTGMGWGYGMNPYYPGFYNPGWGYYPPYGAGGYYPGYGNDFGSYFNARTPNVVLRGNSTARGGRNNTGGYTGSGSNNTSATKSGKQAIRSNKNAYTANQGRQATKTTTTSRLRNQYATQQRGYRSTANTATVRGNVANRNFYEKTSRKPVSTVQRKSATTPRTGATQRSNTTRTNTLRQQANRVLNSNQSSTTRSSSARTRVNTNSGRSSSGQVRSGSSAPRSSSGGSVRQSRPSSGGGGSTRSSGGGSVRGRR